MRIVYRASGGRGEYELAGRQEGISVSDVFDRELVFSLLPGWAVRLGATIRMSNGKPRLRLTEPGRNSHPYQVLLAALLLPAGTRQGPWGSTPALLDGAFRVERIEVAVVRLVGDEVWLRPTQLVLANEVATRDVDVAGRLGELLLGGAPLLRDHVDALRSGQREAVLASASKARGEGLGLLLVPELNAPSQGPDTHDLPTPPPVLARVAGVAKVRQVLAKAPRLARFREDVRAAWDYRCAFTGWRLPRLACLPSAGVQAAHIMPWARYDVEHVTNGLSLSPLAHWAFDSGLLRVTAKQGTYLVTFRPKLADLIGMDRAPFEPMLGEIPVERLPTPANRPNPEFLRRLEEELSG